MPVSEHTPDLGAIARAALAEAEGIYDHWRVPGLLRELAALPDAGSWNDEDLYDDEHDIYRRGRLALDCPHCGRRHRPLLSPTRATVEFGMRWVGLDHREPYVEHIARCPRSRRWYLFTTYTPQ